MVRRNCLCAEVNLGLIWCSICEPSCEKLRPECVYRAAEGQRKKLWSDLPQELLKKHSVFSPSDSMIVAKTVYMLREFSECFQSIVVLRIGCV